MTKDSAATGDTDPSKATPKFEVNEKVLCFHGPLIYEGKVLKMQFKGVPSANEWAYWIHYAGWNKSWDEFVVESRVLKYTEANLEIQRNLKTAQEEKAERKSKTSGKSSTGKKRTSTMGSDAGSVASASESRSSTPTVDNQKGGSVKGSSGKGGTSSLRSGDDSSYEGKRKRPADYVESEGYHTAKQEIQITIPESIRLFLVDDWEFVTRQRRLVKVPVKQSVEQILEDYLQTRESGDMYAVELCNGLREYFNAMLGSVLLYRYEREQYLDILKSLKPEGAPETTKEGETPITTKQMSEVYGVTHLARLFTKLGACIAYTNVDAEAVQVLQKAIDEFLKFLETNFSKYFSLEDYGVSDPEYQRQVPA